MDPLVIVQSRNGRIKGKNLSEDVRAWLGVPYAEPPVGRYRLDTIQDFFVQAGHKTTNATTVFPRIVSTETILF